MRIILALIALVVLSGCVAPASRPFVSPLASTFDSQLPPETHLTYLPLAASVANKRGVSLACGAEDLARTQREIAALGVAWVWNWGTQPPTFPGVESVPGVWNASFIGQPLGGNSAWLLGFNEPEHADQSNMTPEAGARAWRDLEAAYPDRKLTSPQVVHPGEYWLERWYAAYVVYYEQAPKIDALAVHTYYGNDITDYKRQVTYYVDLAAQWGVEEVWVTEFAFAPALDGTVRNSVEQLTDYIAWLDQQPAVTRYSVWTNRVECTDIAPDGIFDTPLYAASGVLTAAGRAYARPRFEE
ncbi:MAG: hypothetical protein HGB05_22535 [Chloroflexi bacterium]|nr:hypothetical protein [Chloroflexota bacterium]